MILSIIYLWLCYDMTVVNLVNNRLYLFLMVLLERTSSVFFISTIIANEFHWRSDL